MNKIKTLKFLFYFIFFSALMGFISQYIISKDASLPYVKKEIIESDDINFLTGKIKKIEVLKYTSVSESVSHPAYKHYKIHVTGDRGKILVDATAFSDMNKDKPSVSIKIVERN